MTLRSLICLCAAVLPLSLTAGLAQSVDTPRRPDFSGRWRMVKEQSDFGKFGTPDLIIRVVEHHDPTLNVHTIQTKGKSTTSADVSYYTSGAETTNTMSGRDAVSKAFWDDSTLVIRTETKNSKDEDTEIIDRWDLSPDGKTLTTTSHIATTEGGADLKLVCRKEAAH